MDRVYKLVGFDSIGVRRVWGADHKREDAEAKCLEEAQDYIRRRPETGETNGMAI